MNDNDIAQWASKLTKEEIETLPFIIGRKDLQHRFIDGSKPLIEMYGVPSCDHLPGLRTGDLPCQVSEFSDFYEYADKECIVKREKTSQIGMHGFAGRDFMAILVNRFPFYGEDQAIKGSLFVTTDITTLPIITISKWFEQNDSFVLGSQIAKSGRTFSILHDNTFLYLTKRETEVLFYVVRGYSNTQIAALLGIQKYTVVTYIDNIKVKMLCDNKQQIIEKAIDLDFINMIPASLLERVQYD